MTQVSESDYRTAQEGNAKVRQEFLDVIDLEDAREFVKRVKYYIPSKETKSYNQSNFAMAIQPGILPISRNRDLIVFSEAFTECSSLNYFLSGLIDHEGQHARQLKTHPMLATLNFILRVFPGGERGEYLTDLVELSAYANQKQLADYRHLTSYQEKILDKRITKYLKNIKWRSEMFFPARNPNNDLLRIFCDSPGDNLLRRLMDNKNNPIY